MRIWKNILLTALLSLRRNLLRSTLTVLGIVIGIAAVIAMMELGNGSAHAIQSTIAAMGANTVMVLPGMAASAGVSFGAGTELTLTADDAEAVGALAGSIKAAAPIIRSKGQLVYGNSNWVPSTINGTSPSFFIAREWRVVEGTPFTDREVRAAAKVCLVGQTVVRELFHGISPVGKEVRLQNVSLRVIGVLEGKGANMMGSDQDDVVILPWSTLKYRVTGTSGASTANSTQNSASGVLYPTGAASLYPRNEKSDSQGLSMRLMNVDQILVGAYSAETIRVAIDEITALLRDRHHLHEGMMNDFSLRNMTEMTKAMSATGLLMTRLLLVVALISLVVGGVGIMNIMLVTVTERTREIGLRMAVGAKGRDILKQFLTEAIVLCVIGGGAGLALGKGASFLVQRLLGWPVQSSPDVVVAALGVSVLVGIVFGFYPAWKGAQLDPIEALRYE